MQKNCVLNKKFKKCINMNMKYNMKKMLYIKYDTLTPSQSDDFNLFFQHLYLINVHFERKYIFLYFYSWLGECQNRMTIKNTKKHILVLVKVI